MGVKRSHLFGLVRDRWDKLQRKPGGNGHQMDMFGQSSFVEAEDPVQTGDELPYDEILSGEKEALGFYFSQHPLASLVAEIRRVTPHDTASVKEVDIAEDVTIVGIVNGYREITTKRGDRMASVTFEDTKGIIETIVFPDLLSKHLLTLKSEKPLVVTGTVEKSEDGSAKLRVKQITLFEEILSEIRRTVKLKVDCRLFKRQELKKLKDVLYSIRGDSKVQIEFLLNGQREPLSLNEVRIDSSKLDVLGKHFRQGLEVEVIG
jgi:DNA polymerase-3 subunit alpha